MREDTGASVPDRALVSDRAQLHGLGPSGFDPSRVAVEALREIRDLEPTPFDFPADWHDAIEQCDECKRYSGHPIQQGICNDHRRPLWARETHDKHEAAALGYRMKRIAMDALYAIAMEARQGGDGETRLHPKDDSAGLQGIAHTSAPNNKEG